MNLEARINAFSRLGDHIRTLQPDEFNALTDAIAYQNPWFTTENVRMALQGIAKLLNKDGLTKWTSGYQFHPSSSKTIGLAMAGNIPLVGFHDFLSVLIAGHRVRAKLSSVDSILVPHLANKLISIEPEFGKRIHFEERLNNVDAVIATGSDNTARYFEYYFRNIPHIIRKNRSSCAVLSGNENGEQLSRLGKDVFSYFGLGCRNVSKLFLPDGYDLVNLFPSWESFSQIIHHHKYVNNYDYQKSILLVNKIPFYDNGFVLLKEEEAFVSPISVLFYEYYKNTEELKIKINNLQEKIQCIVSSSRWFAGSEDFGEAQFPGLSDYADKVDTLAFFEKV
jgi:hypothetical protein